LGAGEEREGNHTTTKFFFWFEPDSNLAFLASFAPSRFNGVSLLVGLRRCLLIIGCASKLQDTPNSRPRISKSNDPYLTQDRGSSGAQDYLAEVTFTLTENPGIKSVNFIFQAGDHAMPGTYSRENFTSYRLVIDDKRKRR
jgi:hypothetical protein